ncbi:MAG TPA: hypothetical protein VNL70_07170, partial [Tepidisphaeraceae bacterium]|nr:hypothetical protein [Tepidisphaeraceae bacterium]
VNAAAAACAAAEPARVGLIIADASGIGTNRRNPAGPADPQAPVLLLRRRRDDSPLAAMLVVSMHPTVLHEDSTLISGDLPAMTRQYLQANLLGANCPVLWHTGAAGNLSPRHVVREHSFAEARRLGGLLGAAIARQVRSMQFLDSVAIECRRELVDLPLRSLPSVQQAELQVQLAAQRLDQLCRQAAPPAQVRTAECDWFGARETLALARAAADGRIGAVAASCLPAEVQLIRIGPWNFVAWPGEIFVEFALEVKRRCPQTFIISYANGELQGYLVTQEAVDEGGYEASNALFKSPDSPNLLVQATLRLAGRHTGQKATP